MISRVDVLCRMAGYQSIDELFDDIERVVLAAADKGLRSIIYPWPKNISEELINEVYALMHRNGYSTEGGYEAMILKW